MTLFERARLRLRALVVPWLECARSLLWAPFESAALVLCTARAGTLGAPDGPLLIARFRDYARGGTEPSTEAVHLERPLASAGIAYESFYWESLEGAWFKGLPLWRAAGGRPHRALVLSSYSPGRWDQPLPGALRVIRGQLGIPVVAIWWDTCSPSFAESVGPAIDLADVHVIADNPGFDSTRFGPAADRFLVLWPPCDPAYYRMELSRDIPVSFSGQVAAYRGARTRFVEKLRALPGAVVAVGAGRSTQPPYADYVALLNRSRIAVNFSWSVDRHQLKARVIETMLSGAMLLESRNPQTAAYFEDGRDYVSFDGPDEMLDRIRHFEDHPAERVAIAEAGRRKASERYSGQAFWQRVQDRLSR
jgi:hypothetical protein